MNFVLADVKSAKLFELLANISADVSNSLFQHIISFNSSFLSSGPSFINKHEAQQLIKIISSKQSKGTFNLIFTKKLF